MKSLSVLMLVFISQLAISQSEILVNLKDYTIEELYWQDTLLERQVVFWDNGKIQVEYAQLHDSIRLRKEYFENGNLKLTAEVYQTYGKLTESIWDLATEEFITTIDSGYLDILHGTYNEYWDRDYTTIKSTGTFTHNVQFGEWTEKQIDRNLIVATYNENGNLDGPYYEYYPSGENHRERIKWKGKFKEVSYTYSELDDLTLKPTGRQIESVHSNKSGIWSHYNQAGELLETVTYEWKKK